jgi:diguanylate cyclase (GGDEF)-like protein
MSEPEQEPKVTREELAQLSLFASADLDALEPVLRGCAVQTLERGETLIAGGETNRSLYLVLSGELTVHLESECSPVLAWLPAGSTAGEVSLIDHEPASAFVVAAKPTRVLVLDEELLFILADSSHAVAYNLLRTLASRVRDGNVTIRHDRERIERYKWQASVDGLTGLFNRHWMAKVLARQMERSRVNAEPLTLLMVDVDHFKAFNDAHGHVAGDYALRAVADCLRATVRPTDLLARYGGEEFLVLLPGAPLRHAREVAERLRRAVREATIQHLDGTVLPHVTVSIGAAELPEGEERSAPEAFVQRADRALYRAKSEGRDRVAV